MFVNKFESMFGVRLNIPHVNRSPVEKRKRREMVTDEVRERVEAHCAPDLKVYSYVLDHFVSSGTADMKM